ncbi:MAG TPA: hypothetical protein VGO00_01515 [Kofleriaceae bacterium]|nr:hypothetical protein [Kofleriaceae bacterium]
MRSGSTAIAGSVVVHAIAVGALGWWTLTHEDEPVIAKAPIDITIEDAAPTIPVEFVPASAGDDTSGAAIPAPAAVAAIASTRGSAAVSTGRATSIETRPGPTAGTEHGHELMKMRGPDLALSPEFFAKLGPGEAHPPPPSSDWLDPRAGGRFHIDDEVVSIDVRQDGTVKLNRKADIDIHWALPIPSLHDLGDMLQAWREDPYAATRVGPTQDLPAHELAVPGTWDSGTNGNPDGNPTPHPHGDGSQGSVIPLLGGNLDLTSWAMRKFAHQDAYDSRKKKLLDDTRDERAYHGGAYKQEQLNRSAELMRGNLERLWLSTLDPAARREALFAMWDECAEGEGGMGEAGERARGQVIGWIAARLPKGSPGAFTDEEIAKLDAKRSSKAHFAPY